MQRWRNTLLALGMLGTLAGPCAAQLFDHGAMVVTNLAYTGTDVPVGILAVNPGTGDQDVISAFGLFLSPFDLRLAPSGNIIVLDGGVMGGSTGAVISVDPKSGAQTALTSGGAFNNYAGSNGYGALHVDAGGNIYVALSNVGVFQVDPATGNQTMITSGGMLIDPSGLASTPDGNLYVGDYTSMGGALFLVDVHSGAQTLIASGDMINGVVDIAVEPSGTVLVENGNNSLVRVDPSSGKQSLVASGLMGLNGLAVGSDGQIYVVSDPSSSVASSIIRVDPATGDQTVISAGGIFGFLGGLVQAP
jgi:streptogramin lyase